MEPNPPTATPGITPVSTPSSPSEQPPAASADSPSAFDSAFENTFLHPEPAHASFLAKHAIAVLLAGVGISTLLIAIGVLFHVTYQAKDDQDRNAAVLQQEIESLDAEISDLTASDYEAFQNNGFSANFYSSNTRTNAELQRTDLQHALDAVSTANASANIVNTGAIYFFLAGMVCLFVAITIFLVTRRRPQSASIIVD